MHNAVVVFALKIRKIYQLFPFLSYPPFIEAFLKSPVVVCDDIEMFNAYSLNNITLPGSYQHYEKYGVFDALPEALQTALKQRYAEQQKKEKCD